MYISCTTHTSCVWLLLLLLSLRARGESNTHKQHKYVAVNVESTKSTRITTNHPLTTPWVSGFARANRPQRACNPMHKKVMLLLCYMGNHHLLGVKSLSSPSLTQPRQVGSDFMTTLPGGWVMHSRWFHLASRWCDESEWRWYHHPKESSLDQS